MRCALPTKTSMKYGVKSCNMHSRQASVRADIPRIHNTWTIRLHNGAFGSLPMFRLGVCKVRGSFRIRMGGAQLGLEVNSMTKQTSLEASGDNWLIIIALLVPLEGNHGERFVYFPHAITCDCRIGYAWCSVTLKLRDWRILEESRLSLAPSLLTSGVIKSHSK